MTYPAQGLREVQDNFTWGVVLDVVQIPLGKKYSPVSFVSYHPWESKNSEVKVGHADTKQILWHCAEHSWSDTTLAAAIIRYLAHKNLGLNQQALVSGLLRALDIETATEEVA